MGRGFKGIQKETKGKSAIAREATCSYLIKTSKIDDPRNESAKKWFKSKPYGLGDETKH